MKPIGNDKEDELIRRMQHGDYIAMRDAYDLYAGYLTAVCSRYIVDPEDVRDILQDSFIKIFSGIGAYEKRENASLKSWMAKIVVNEALKFIKRNDRFSFIENSDDVPDAPDADIEVDGVPFAELLEMIKKLPANYRAVFNLFVFERKSHKEIATLLNIKENTSASHFHRAKAALAKNIKQHLASAI